MNCEQNITGLLVQHPILDKAINGFVTDHCPTVL
jgi:hypothetical protein